MDSPPRCESPNASPSESPPTRPPRRQVILPNGLEVLLTDTVGFARAEPDRRHGGTSATWVVTPRPSFTSSSGHIDATGSETLPYAHLRQPPLYVPCPRAPCPTPSVLHSPHRVSSLNSPPRTPGRSKADNARAREALPFGIQKLPTTLIAAFKSTLEELQEASLIIHLVDIASTGARAQPGPAPGA